MRAQPDQIAIALVVHEALQVGSVLPRRFSSTLRHGISNASICRVDRLAVRHPAAERSSRL
jgi:hypothetical protein